MTDAPSSGIRTHRYATVVLRDRLFTADYKGVVEPRNQLAALDYQWRPIPGTYLGRILPDPPLPGSQELPPLEEIPAGFLFYATPWHTNFQHFLTETYPKVVDYRELAVRAWEGLPLLVPRFMLNGFVLDVLDLLGLTSRVRVLESPRTYVVGELHTSGYVPNFDPPGRKEMVAWKLLGARALEACRPEPPARARRVYLARESRPDPARNNSNAGALRVITNEPRIQDALRGRGFEDLLMAGLDIAGKTRALAGAEAIVSPLGANLMNLLFLTPPLPRKILILHSSTTEIHAAWFRGVLEVLFDGNVQVDTFGGPAAGEAENSPYALDAGAFDHFLDCHFNPWAPRMFPPWETLS